jgi:hypothetical protein
LFFLILIHIETTTFLKSSSIPCATRDEVVFLGWTEKNPRDMVGVSSNNQILRGFSVEIPHKEGLYSYVP